MSASAGRKSRQLLLALVAGGSLLTSSSTLEADDLILSGSNPVRGVTISKATWDEVEYKLPGVSRKQKMASNRIDSIVWTNEPPSLSRGRNALGKGDFARAVSSFKAASSINEEVYKFNALYMTGKAELAWSRQDPSHVAAAVTALKDYVSQAKGKKHFYVPHGVLALAEAHMAAGDYSQAESVLRDLSGGSMGQKWVEGAKLKSAQVKLAQEKYGDARELFRDVQGSSNPSFALEARVGYASCQVGQKQYPGAVTTLEDLLGESPRERNTSPPGYGDLRAKAWIVYGQAEEGAAGSDKTKQQWAVYRYLRASVVAVGGGEVFAEALYRAKELYKKMGQSDRAELISQRMNQLCPNSPWTKR